MKIVRLELTNNKGRTLTFQDDLLMIFELGYAPKVIRDVGYLTINDKAFEKFFKLKLTKIKP